MTGKIGKEYDRLPDNKCICTRCGETLSANAFARFKHDAKAHKTATAAIATVEPTPTQPVRGVAGRAKAAELFEILNKIANATRWQRPEPQSLQAKILTSLELRRDALRAVVGTDDQMYRLLTPVNRGLGRSDAVRFAPVRSYPIGQGPATLDPGPIPKFLRRIA